YPLDEKGAPARSWPHFQLKLYLMAVSRSVEIADLRMEHKSHLRGAAQFPERAKDAARAWEGLCSPVSREKIPACACPVWYRRSTSRYEYPCKRCSQLARKILCNRSVLVDRWNGSHVWLAP